MGFFQDLKEDLSIAVDELTGEAIEPEKADAGVDSIEASIAALSEAEKEMAAPEETPAKEAKAEPEVKEEAAPEEEPKQEAKPEPEVKPEPEAVSESDDADVMPSEDLAKALEQADVIKQEKDAISPDGKAAPVFGEQMQLDLGLAAVASEQTKEKAPKGSGEAKEKPAKVDPTIEAAASELKSIADNIVNNKEEAVPEAAAEGAKSVQEPEKEMAEEVKKEEVQTTEAAKPVEALKPEDMEGEPVDENAVITKCMTVRGDVLSKGSIELQGIVEGNVTALGKLNVSGKLQGDAKAAEVFADAAQICGQIHADGTAKIGKDSVIIGNIFASSAVIAGAVKGDIDVHGPVILDSSAIVMGNIKSKSVQINNGAAIEGMCSQCYAENSPSSFFDRFGK